MFKENKFNGKKKILAATLALTLAFPASVIALSPFETRATGSTDSSTTATFDFATNLFKSLEEKIENFKQDLLKTENDIKTARELVLQEAYDLSDLGQIYDLYTDTNKAYDAAVEAKSKLEDFIKARKEIKSQRLVFLNNIGFLYGSKKTEVTSEFEKAYDNYSKVYDKYVEARKNLEKLEEIQAETANATATCLEKLENAQDWEWEIEYE